MKAPSVRVLGVAGAALALAVSVAAWALGWAAWRDDTAWREVVANGVLRVATDPTYPPFAAVDADGNLFGFDIDLAEALAERLTARAGRPVRAEFDALAYDALLPALVAGRDAAVISALVAQPERLAEVRYTRSYFVAGTVVVVPAGSGPAAFSEAAWVGWAAGRRLAVEYGAGGDVAARRWARLAAAVTVLPQPSPAEALTALAEGRADAALVDALAAYDFLAGRPEYALAGAPVDPEPYVIAVGVRSSTLGEALDQLLAEMEADGSLAALRARWLGEAAGRP